MFPHLEFADAPDEVYMSAAGKNSVNDNVGFPTAKFAGIKLFM